MHVFLPMLGRTGIGLLSFIFRKKKPNDMALRVTGDLEVG